MMAKPLATIPLTVIGGFLGAGKTTLLNQLLRGGTGRYAVLVNDFGAVNIDASLIARHDGETMTLTNGCVCCSIGAGFIETLGKVLDAKTSFDHIIIEASGVGDPWRIAEIALIEPALSLSAVVVLADATRIARLLFDPKVGETVRGQFDRCDVVLLTKADLVEHDGITAACEALTFLRSDLRIVETSELRLPDVADLATFARARSSRFRADVASSVSDHEAKFRRWSYRRPHAFDRALFMYVLRTLPPEMVRLKGYCSFTDEAGQSLLQLVDQAWTLLPDPSGAQDGINLVGIGTADLLSDAQLSRIFDGALASVASQAIPVQGDLTQGPRASSLRQINPPDVSPNRLSIKPKNI